MTERAEPKPPARLLRRWYVVVAAVLAGLVLVYTFAGFWLVPWLAKRELPRLIAEKPDLTAKLGEIRFNPFTLAIAANDFAIGTRDGKPMLGFDNAIMDLEWRSILRRAWVSHGRRIGLATGYSVPDTESTGSSPESIRFKPASARRRL